MKFAAINVLYQHDGETKFRNLAQVSHGSFYARDRLRAARWVRGILAEKGRKHEFGTVQGCRKGR